MQAKKEGLSLHLTLSGLKRGSAGICLFSLLAWENMVGAAPVTLEQAVHMALENHLDIKIAANEEEQAEYALQSAKDCKIGCIAFRG